MATSHLIFLGTYTRSTSKGIYATRLDAETGALSEPFLVAEATNPTWLEISADRKFLYTIHASAAQAIGFALEAGDGAAIPNLTPLAAPSAPAPAASAPSHLAIDASGRTLLAANYADGYVAAIPIRADGSPGTPEITRHDGPPGPHPTRQTKPYPHSVTLSPDNRHAIVCDLGLDRIYSYALTPPPAGGSAGASATPMLAPASPPFVSTAPGAGPRHFKFNPPAARVAHEDSARVHAYVINELDNTISVFDYAAATGQLTPRQTVPTLPADFTAPNTTAEIRVHPNGRFLYGSNRGHDSIAVFAIEAATGELAFIERVPTGGRNPRNFALSPDGRWLVCGHQDTELLTVFRVDAATGRVTRMPHTAKIPMCVCVLFYN